MISARPNGASRKRVTAMLSEMPRDWLAGFRDRLERVILAAEDVEDDYGDFDDLNIRDMTIDEIDTLMQDIDEFLDGGEMM